jgi:hypothetical protein
MFSSDLGNFGINLENQKPHNNQNDSGVTPETGSHENMFKKLTASKHINLYANGGINPSNKDKDCGLANTLE